MRRQIEYIKGILILVVCLVVPMIVGYKINETIYRKKEAYVIQQFLASTDDATIIINDNNNENSENNEEEIDLGGDGNSEYITLTPQPTPIEKPVSISPTPTSIQTPKVTETPIPTKDLTQIPTPTEQISTPFPTQEITTPTPTEIIKVEDIDTDGVGRIEGDILYLDAKFKLTFYCPCEKCCGPGGGKKTASGTTPTAGRTIAVCKDQIPFGTKVIIEGHEFIAEDTGGAIKWNRIDVFVNSHQEALNLGVMKNVTVGIKR